MNKGTLVFPIISIGEMPPKACREGPRTGWLCGGRAYDEASDEVTAALRVHDDPADLLDHLDEVAARP